MVKCFEFSVLDIEEMRAAIRNLEALRTNLRGGQSEAVIEDRLRTYMANGTWPSELVKAVELLNEEAQRRMQAKGST